MSRTRGFQIVSDEGSLTERSERPAPSERKIKRPVSDERASDQSSVAARERPSDHPTEPKPKAKSRKSLPKAYRTNVWNHYVGERWGRTWCWCCQTTRVTLNDFEVGHVIPVSRGGTEQAKLEDVRVICGACNRSCATKNLIEFRRECQREPTLFRKVVNSAFFGFYTW